MDWVPDFYTKQYEWADWAAVWGADASEASSIESTHLDGGNQGKNTRETYLLVARR